MQHIVFRHFVTLLMFTLLFASCSPNDPSENSSLLHIQLTDSPPMVRGEFPDIEIRDIYIDIRSIEMLVDEEWVMSGFQGGEYNVLHLTNGRLRQISSQWFPANKTITKIRVTFGDNSRIVNTANQAIRLITPGEIVAENVNAKISLHTISSIVIDLNTVFFHHADNNTFHFDSSIRAFAQNFGFSLRGTIDRVESRPLIKISRDGYMPLFSLPEANGMFMFIGLPAAEDTNNEWKIEITPLAEGSAFLDTTFVHTIDLTRRVNDLGQIRLHPNIISPDDDDDDDDDDEEEDDDDE